MGRVKSRFVLPAVILVAGVGFVLTMVLTNSQGVSTMDPRPGNALRLPGSSGWNTTRQPFHDNFSVYIAPIFVYNYSTGPITMLSERPTGVTAGLRLIRSFEADLCYASWLPAIVDAQGAPLAVNYGRMRVVGPIEYVPVNGSKVCCHRGVGRPGCQGTSSRWFQVFEFRASAKGTFRIRGFEMEYRAGRQIYREFFHQELILISLGSCRRSSCAY